jgi:hypothetical protein
MSLASEADKNGRDQHNFDEMTLERRLFPTLTIEKGLCSMPL